MFDPRHFPPDWTAKDLAQCEVIDGLNADDFAPLAAYLRAGQPVDGWLAEELALAIEDPGLQLRRTVDPSKKPGPKEDKVLRLSVGAFVHIRDILSPRGSLPEIYFAATKRFKVFGITDRYAKDALSVFRKSDFDGPFSEPRLAWARAVSELWRLSDLEFVDQLSSIFQDGYSEPTSSK